MRKDMKERRIIGRRREEPGAVAYKPQKGGLAWLWWVLGLLALLVIGLIAFALFNDTNEAGTTGAVGGEEQGEAVQPGNGTIEVGGNALFPLSANFDLSQYSGETVKADKVTAVSVVSDEGFWVGQSEDQRVFVLLTDPGESGPNVQDGDEVSFTGTVVQNPQDFVESHGITQDEGAQLLEKQGYHIEVQIEDFQVV